MSYAVGVACAVVAGGAINAGLLIQKGAVAKIPGEAPLLRALVANPVWLSGLVLQFLLGTPLYIVSVGIIGPALVPGLMSIGLAVLAVGAFMKRGEGLSWSGVAGIALVMLAVAAFGCSRLAIDVHARALVDGDLLVRAGIVSFALALVARGCSLAAARCGEERPLAAATWHAVRAGVWYQLGNLGLGFVLVALARFGAGRPAASEIVVFVAAVALTGWWNLLGIAATQHALRRGRASVVIPVQNGVPQLIPVAVFFLVYRPYAPSGESIAFLCAALVLLAAGGAALTGRFPRPR